MTDERVQRKLVAIDPERKSGFLGIEWRDIVNLL